LLRKFVSPKIKFAKACRLQGPSDCATCGVAGKQR
jgi:hypothetical protein